MLCDAQVKYATKLNVFATIPNALHHSKTIRDGVRHVNELQVHSTTRLWNIACRVALWAASCADAQCRHPLFCSSMRRASIAI